jgi:hypothetical protein
MEFGVRHDQSRRGDKMPMQRHLVQLDPRSDPNTQVKLAQMQLIYSVGGLILGFSCIIGGVVLFLHGVAGSTSWTASVLGMKSQISDAAPGAILFIVGLFMVWVTRFVVKHKSS